MALLEVLSSLELVPFGEVVTFVAIFPVLELAFLLEVVSFTLRIISFSGSRMPRGALRKEKLLEVNVEIFLVRKWSSTSNEESNRSPSGVM